MIVSVIDNLVKGAAGQAIQNANIDGVKRNSGSLECTRYIHNNLEENDEYNYNQLK